MSTGMEWLIKKKIFKIKSCELIFIQHKIFDLIINSNKFYVDFLLDKLNQCLISFSVVSNTTKLFKISNKDTMNCLNGFRLISILFIILYHTYTEAQLPSG